MNSRACFFRILSRAIGRRQGISIFSSSDIPSQIYFTVRQLPVAKIRNRDKLLNIETILVFLGVPGDVLALIIRRLVLWFKSYRWHKSIPSPSWNYEAIFSRSQSSKPREFRPHWVLVVWPRALPEHHLGNRSIVHTVKTTSEWLRFVRYGPVRVARAFRPCSKHYSLSLPEPAGVDTDRDPF